MNEEDILKDALEAEKEVYKEQDEEYHKKQKRNKIIWFVIALLLVLMFVLWYIPYDAITLDPEPKNIPKLSDFSFEERYTAYQNVSSPYEYPLLLTPFDSQIKRVADKIAVQSCYSNERVCFAKALFYFVRDNFDYVNDPLSFEYVKSAQESLLSQGGDCDDASVLLANLMRALGIETRFVFIPGHVYLQIYLPEAVQKYKEEQHWINLDATCKNCAFGEIPWNSNKAEKRYV